MTNMSPDLPNSTDQEPRASLVEVKPGLAVLFADEAPAGLELMPFDLLGDEASRRLTDQLSVAVGAGNMGAAAAAAAATMPMGLVQLAPETIKALETATPLTSGGWNLGVLTEGGQFSQQIRWAPVAGPQAAQVLASIGPAAVLLAVQMQLASISRRVDEVIDLTRGVIEAIHQDQWATLQGLRDTTIGALREAQAVGFVNDHIFTRIGSKEADLRKQQHLFLSLVTAHLRELDADAAKRRDYLVKNARQIAADAQGLLIAEGSWYRYQVLRAAHIAHDVEHAVENEKLLQKLVDDAERGHTEALAELTGLLSELERQCHLAAELGGGGIRAKVAPSKTLAASMEMAEVLAGRVAALQGSARPVMGALRPSIAGVEKEVPEEVLRILRWLVPFDDELVAIADVNLDRMVGGNAWLGVTKDQLFISSHRAVRNEGLLEHVIRLDDVRYVRFRERGKQGPSLDVITKDVDFHLTFDSWATSCDGVEKARRVADCLAAAMNLPETELVPPVSFDELEGC